MEWIIYLSFVFFPILFIWIMLWIIEKKIPERYESDIERQGAIKFVKLKLNAITLKIEKKSI